MMLTYRSPYADTRTRTRVCVNAALLICFASALYLPTFVLLASSFTFIHRLRNRCRAALLIYAIYAPPSFLVNGCTCYIRTYALQFEYIITAIIKTTVNNNNIIIIIIIISIYILLLLSSYFCVYVDEFLGTISVVMLNNASNYRANWQTD